MCDFPQGRSYVVARAAHQGVASIPTDELVGAAIALERVPAAGADEVLHADQRAAVRLDTGQCKIDHDGNRG